jgi:hypothetical protein
MKWYWIIPICLAIIGWFGIFWTLNLSNINIDIATDENSEAIIDRLANATEQIAEYQYCDDSFYIWFVAQPDDFMTSRSRWINKYEEWHSAQKDKENEE